MRNLEESVQISANAEVSIVYTQPVKRGFIGTPLIRECIVGIFDAVGDIHRGQLTL
jgi:hypothetical protein